MIKTKFLRKIKSMSNWLTKLHVRDFSRYTCVAENAYGRIETSAEAHLVSSSPPVIIEGPENQKVSLGSTVIFRCRADGEPRPFITWFLNGGEIHVLKGHFHVSSFSICYITHSFAPSYSFYTKSILKLDIGWWNEIDHFGSNETRWRCLFMYGR